MVVVANSHFSYIKKLGEKKKKKTKKKGHARADCGLLYLPTNLPTRPFLFLFVYNFHGTQNKIIIKKFPTLRLMTPRPNTKLTLIKMFFKKKKTHSPLDITSGHREQKSTNHVTFSGSLAPITSRFGLFFLIEYVLLIWFPSSFFKIVFSSSSLFGFA